MKTKSKKKKPVTLNEFQKILKKVHGQPFFKGAAVPDVVGIVFCEEELDRPDLREAAATLLPKDFNKVGATKGVWSSKEANVQTLPKDSVNHPFYYNQGKIEVIEFIEDKSLGFHLGNAIKYVARAGKKDPNKTVEDLRKAIWYINRQIELHLAKEQGREVAKPNDTSIKK